MSCYSMSVIWWLLVQKIICTESSSPVDWSSYARDNVLDLGA